MIWLTIADVAPDESDTLYRCAKPNVPELLHSRDVELLEAKGILLEDRLASGNYGSVHRAVQGGKPIAVKIVAHHLYDVRLQPCTVTAQQ